MKIHEFDNGVKVYDYHLLAIQRERYKHRNVHEEDEEDIFISIVKKLPPGALYVNVGSAIGYYPLLARTLRADLKIHCFEPLPRHLRYFRENIVLNGFAERDFAIHKIAVSSSTGTAAFKDNSYASSLSLKESNKLSKRNLIRSWIELFLGKDLASSFFKVATVKLSEISDFTQSSKIDFLQMDIQGFEEPVLSAYFSTSVEQRPMVSQFLVGTHGLSIHRKCRSFFENSGFQIRHDEQDPQHQPDGILYAALAI